MVWVGMGEILPGHANSDSRITITLEGVQYESDARHAELMVGNLGLGDSNGVRLLALIR